MSDDMIRIGRKSSPRTGREFDTKWVPRKKLNHHLAAGWTKVQKKEPAKLSYSDFSDLEMDNINRDPRTLQELASIHNTTVYCIRKIKGQA